MLIGIRLCWTYPDWERDMLVEHVNRLNVSSGCPQPTYRWQALNLTNAERERLQDVRRTSLALWFDVLFAEPPNRLRRLCQGRAPSLSPSLNDTSRSPGRPSSSLSALTTRTAISTRSTG